MATIDTVAAQVTALQADFDARELVLQRDHAWNVYTIIAAPSDGIGLTGEGEFTPATPAALGAPYLDLTGFKLTLATVPDYYGRRGISRKAWIELGYVMLRDKAGTWTPPIELIVSGQGAWFGRVPGDRLYYNLAPGVVLNTNALYTRSDQP